jgi:hypothetical protein
MGVRIMQLKHALSTAVLAVPLLLAGAAPSTANIEVGLGAESPYYDGYYGPGYYRYGWGSGYYGLAPYDPYDDEVFLGAPVDVDDNAIVVEPSAAVPVPCVKTNVKNLRNACPM